MGHFMSGLGKVAGLAAVAVMVYAQRRSARTGKDVVTILSNLPAELKESQAEWQERLMEAVEVGRQAAAEREAELERDLSGDRPQAPQAPATPVTDYIV